VGVVIESSGIGERCAERGFASMAERRVAKIVSQAQSLSEVLVKAERPGERATDLSDFQAVRQADPEMIAVGSDENLRLVAQAPERDRVDDPVAVALEDVAWTARAGVRLRVEAAA
jgi:hypothetical protein